MYRHILPDGTVLEIKTSPEYKYIRVSAVEDGIYKVKLLWKKIGKPPAYIFLFPINEIAEEAKEVLEKFRWENKDVKIAWFDYRAFENILEKIKLFSEDDIIDFIQQNSEAMKYLKNT